MVNNRLNVFVVANDVVPGCSLPVAAPGLRAHGLAHGLRAHDFETTIILPRQTLSSQWGKQPPPTSAGMVVLDTGRIKSYIEQHAPAAVVLTNSNQFRAVEGVRGTHIVYDFFAPKLLELVCQYDRNVDLGEVAFLRRRKLQALNAADAVIVNGEKKIGYALAWLLQTRDDAHRVPLLNVPMCLPPALRSDGRSRTQLRLGIAGYLQNWSVPRTWLGVLEDLLEQHDLVLDVLLPQHWGGESATPRSEQLIRLLRHPNVRSHGLLLFDEYQAFLHELDIVVDLFERTRERELAMVTRTVVALACGVPVVHPTFTEVSPYIDRAGAGWLLDVEDEVGLRQELTRIVTAQDEIAARTQAARMLASTVFDPWHAVAPLAEVLGDWGAD